MEKFTKSVKQQLKQKKFQQYRYQLKMKSMMN